MAKQKYGDDFPCWKNKHKKLPNPLFIRNIERFKIKFIKTFTAISYIQGDFSKWKLQLTAVQM